MGITKFQMKGILKNFLNLIKSYSVTDKSIQSIINNDATVINFQVRTNTDDKDINNALTEEDFREFEKIIIKDLNEIALKDGRFTVKVWGDLFLMSRIIQYLLKEQIKAPIITLFLILLTALILLRSIHNALFSIIPLTYSLMMNFFIDEFV